MWGKGKPEISVSAYALRFLSEASEFTEVDPDVVAAARRWLLQQATPQGTWMERGSDGKLLESYAAVRHRIRRRGPRGAISTLRNPSEKDIEVEREAVRKAIEHFAKSRPRRFRPLRHRTHRSRQACCQRQTRLKQIATLHLSRAF